MSGGSIIAIIGGLVALLGPILLPFITVDEEEVALKSYEVMTGLVSLGLAALTIGLAAVVYKKRKQMLGWVISIASLAQIGVMAVTYANVWTLVPCAAKGLSLCDPETGGLIDQTLVTLDWGVALVVLSSVMTLFAGLVVVSAHAEFRKEQRFLRVMLTWGGHIIFERVFFNPMPVTVGEGDENTFQLAANGVSKHTLFTPAGPERYKLDVPTGLGGRITVGGETKEASGLGAVEVSRGDAGVLSFDNGVDVVFQFTGAESGVLASTSSRDVGLAVSFSAVAAVMLVLLTAMMASVKDHNRTEAEENLEQKGKELIEITLEDIEEQSDEEEPEGDEDDTTGKKAGGEEGKFGDPDTDPNKTSKVPKMDGKMVDKIDVKNLGIAKVLGGQQALTGALGNIMAGDTGALSSKMAVAMSGEGSELQIGHGSGGMGFRGTGSGGGGSGYGRLHGLGAIDTGGGTGRNANIGIGRKKSKKVAKLKISAGQSQGGCDKGDIAKNVRSRASALRACYETQLLAKPDLSGKVTVQWTITSDGSVSGDKIVSDSMSNSAVTDCVLRAIRRIRFQKPEAGICVIQWPFVFSPG